MQNSAPRKKSNTEGCAEKCLGPGYLRFISGRHDKAYAIYRILARDINTRVRQDKTRLVERDAIFLSFFFSEQICRKDCKMNQQLIVTRLLVSPCTALTTSDTGCR